MFTDEHVFHNSIFYRDIDITYVHRKPLISSLQAGSHWFKSGIAQKDNPFKYKELAMGMKIPIPYETAYCVYYCVKNKRFFPL